MGNIHEETARKGLSREKTIIRTSIIGIIANVFLAVFKAVIGLMTNSIAIVLDAVNNISDAGSSLITIVGTKLAGKEPDKKHPFGYGRIEYLSAMIISVIVLYAGITSFVESVKQIIHPETPDYNTVSLIIVAVAVGQDRARTIRQRSRYKGKFGFPDQFRRGCHAGFHYLRIYACCGWYFHGIPCFPGSMARRGHFHSDH